MQSVIGGVSNTIAYSRIIPATIVIQTPSYHGAGAYVSSSVPVGLTFNMYANVAITNDASITTFSIERQ
jgi:hypothetical protein